MATDQPEPEVIIGGQRLTYAQALTLRVAITTFAMEMSTPEHAAAVGERLAGNYLARAQEVEALMFASIKAQGR